MERRQSVNAAKNGNANVQMAIWGLRARFLFATITLVSMVRHVSPFREAVYSVYVRWERMAITVSIVSNLVNISCFITARHNCPHTCLSACVSAGL